MANLKSLTIWTIVLNFLILVGAGHGVGIIGLIEIISLIRILTGQAFGNEDISFALNSTYEKSLFAVGLFSFIGQLLLLSSLLIKKPDKKDWTKIVGIIFLWIGFYYLVHNIFQDGLSGVGFFTGLPFFICSIIIIYRSQRNIFGVDTPEQDYEC